MSSNIKKRSVRLAGHATSISLEEIFWQELKTIAKIEGKSLNGLITEIDAGRDGNLSSALRTRVILHLKNAIN